MKPGETIKEILVVRDRNESTRVPTPRQLDDDDGS
jgi:hypothetical protein